MVGRLEFSRKIMVCLSAAFPNGLCKPPILMLEPQALLEVNWRRDEYRQPKITIGPNTPHTKYSAFPMIYSGPVSISRPCLFMRLEQVPCYFHQHPHFPQNSRFTLFPYKFHYTIAYTTPLKMGKQFALLVGIDHYTTGGRLRGDGLPMKVNNLQGCVNDVTIMTELLSGFGFHDPTLLISPTSLSSANNPSAP